MYLFVISICFFGYGSVFDTTKSKYKNIWGDLDKTEQEEWCIFLSSIPVIDNLPPENGTRFSTMDDIAAFLTHNLWAGGSEYHDENFVDRLCAEEYKKIGETYFEMDESNTEVKNEIAKLFQLDSSKVNLDMGASMSVEIYHRANCINSLLSKHYGLSPDQNVKPIMDYDCLFAGYIKRYDVYIIRTLVGMKNHFDWDYIPKKMFHIKDDVYYVECYMRWFDNIKDKPEIRKSYFIVDRKDSCWRLYDYGSEDGHNGKGWLSGAELEEKLKKIFPLENESMQDVKKDKRIKRVSV